MKVRYILTVSLLILLLLVFSREGHSDENVLINYMRLYEEQFYIDSEQEFYDDKFYIDYEQEYYDNQFYIDYQQEFYDDKFYIDYEPLPLSFHLEGGSF